LLGEETTRYVFRILAMKIILESPEKYGFFVDPSEIYPSITFKTVVIDSAVGSFADFAKYHKTNYKIFKMLNPWLREADLKNPGKKQYTVKIPLGDFREYHEGD